MASLHTRAVANNDFEDISLGDQTSSKVKALVNRSSRNSGFRDSILSSSGDSSIEEHQLSYPSVFSNLSTPTLSSDTSSVRSSSIASSPRTPPSANFGSKLLAASTPDLQQQKKRVLGRQNSLIDTTSMASLTIRQQSRGMRSRKQREREIDLDNDDEIWPQDEVMFNVPMSPALYAQQKQRLILQRQNGKHPNYLQATLVPPSSVLGSENTDYRRHESLPNIYSHRMQRRPHHSLLEALKPVSDASQPIEESAQSPRTRAVEDGCLSELDGDAFDLTMDLYRLEAEQAGQNSRSSQSSKSGIHSATIRECTEEYSGSSDSLDALPRPNAFKDSDCDSRRSSLTRPENLPPKSMEEERKHLKSYEKMLLDTAAAEKRKMQKQEQESKKRSQQASSDLTVWKSWLAKRGKSSRLPSDVKWRGAPLTLRRDVWRQQAGVLDVAMPIPAHQHEHEIRTDAELVWKECGIFGSGRPLHDSLLRTVQRLLTAYPEIEYKSAITWLVALLLLYMNEDEGTVVALRLFQPNTLPYAVLSGNEQFWSANYVPFRRVLKSQFPQLHSHFAKNGILDFELLNPLMEGLFANVLPTPEMAARIIDLYIFEGDRILLSAALALIKVNEAWLYASKPEILRQLLHPRPVDEETFIKLIQGFEK